MVLRGARLLHRATTKSRQREELESVIDRLRPRAKNDHRSPRRDKPKEVEPRAGTRLSG